MNGKRFSEEQIFGPIKEADAGLSTNDLCRRHGVSEQTGKRLWSPRLAYATCVLLTAGAAMRLLQHPAAFYPAFYELGS